MIDRMFKWIVLALGVVLIVLVGFFVALLNEDVKPPAVPLAPAPRVEAEPGKLDPSPNDIATKRVKTITVRPEEPSTGALRP